MLSYSGFLPPGGWIDSGMNDAFKLMAGAVASCALIGVAVGVGIIYGSLLISIGRNPSQRDELLRYAFIGFSLVEVSGLIGLVISLLLLFGFYLARNTIINIFIS